MAQAMSVKLNGVKEALEMFDPKMVRQAARSTLDKTGTAAKKDMVSEVTANYYIKPEDAKNAIEIKRTTAKELSVSIWTSKKRFELYKYFHAYYSGRGITVEIKRGAPTYFQGGFIQTARQGNNPGWRGVMKRTGKRGYRRPPPEGATQKKLQENISSAKIHGPSIAELVGGPKIINLIKEKAAKNMETLFYQEIDARLAKQGKLAY